MYSSLEFQGQSSLLHKSGTVELNTDCYRTKKPLWLIGLKVLGTLAMIAVGAAIAIPTLLELEFPLWHASAVTAGGMILYTGIAFFVRPEPNTDNLGLGGGMGNDPYQYSDNVNRFLWRMHCVLGPGRFTAETFLDICTYVGLAGESEAAASEQPGAAFTAGRAAPMAAFDATQPIAPLDPNRFAQSSANFVAGQIQLDSQRFFTSAAPAASTPAANA